MDTSVAGLADISGRSPRKLIISNTRNKMGKSISKIVYLILTTKPMLVDTAVPQYHIPNTYVRVAFDVPYMTT